MRCHPGRPARIALIVLFAGSAALAAAPAKAATAVRASAHRVPIGAHSMLYSLTPPAFADAMFAQAAAMGVSEIRVDVDLSAVFTLRGTDWTSVDDYMRLSREYRLRVLADVLATPFWLANCPPSLASQVPSYRCFTDNPTAYAQLVGLLAAHTRGVIDDFELNNEPDLMQVGTPQQYALMLRAIYPAVHHADPKARVVLGGLSGTVGSKPFITSVFDVLGASAAHSFDIANVHVRGPLGSLSRDVVGWRRWFAAHGFNGPLWVTEHGYPSDPAYQYDPAYRGFDQASGLAAQASFLARSIPTIVSAGAAMVFVTERDNLSGQSASEGVLSGNVQDPIGAGPYQITRKPSFATVRALCLDYRAGRVPRGSSTAGFLARRHRHRRGRPRTVRT